MAYKLVFDFDGKKFEFITPSLKDDDLQKAVTLKGSNCKAFLISRAEKKGRMFWGIMKQTDFDIIKIKGEKNEGRCS
jgi:hypothetical protein